MDSSESSRVSLSNTHQADSSEDPSGDESYSHPSSNFNALTFFDQVGRAVPIISEPTWDDDVVRMLSYDSQDVRTQGESVCLNICLA